MSETIGILPAAKILAGERFVIWDCFSCYNSTFNNKLHFHDFYELSLIYEGESDFLVNGEKIKVLPGTIHMVTPSDYHMQMTKEDQTFRYINLIFSHDLLDDDLAAAFENHTRPIWLQPDRNSAESIFSLAQNLLLEYQSWEKGKSFPFSEQLIEHGIQILCIQIARLLDSTQTNEQDSLLPVRKAISIIRREYRREITLQEIADQVYLSPAYLSQLFHKTVGVSFSSYLTDYRLQMAARYLSSNTLLLKEIAPLCGFPTFPYFSAAFKKRFGMSPSEYRKMTDRISTTE